MESEIADIVVLACMCANLEEDCFIMMHTSHTSFLTEAVKSSDFAINIQMYTPLQLVLADCLL